MVCFYCFFFFFFFFSLFLCLWFVTGKKKMHHQCTRGVLEQTWGKSQTEGDERTRERERTLILFWYVDTWPLFFFFIFTRSACVYARVKVSLRLFASEWWKLHMRWWRKKRYWSSKTASQALCALRLFFFFCSRLLPFIFAYFNPQ